MAYDEGLAEILRADLIDQPGVAEKRMFGGLAFMLDGHMIGGVTSTDTENPGMFRPGKAREAEALEMDGVLPLTFTGRPMGGMVEMTAEAFADDHIRQAVLQLAIAHARTLPPK